MLGTKRMVGTLGFVLSVAASSQAPEPLFQADDGPAVRSFRLEADRAARPIVLSLHRGFSLPALKGSGGLFEAKGPGDVAWGDLILGLFVPIGGRVMRRSLGSALYELLFNPVDPEDFALVDYTIRAATQRQLPHVNIVRTEIEAIDRGIQIRVFFRLNNDLDAAPTQRTVLVPKTFVS